MQKIKFTKMHGCGNDYIYVDASRYTIDNPAAAAVAWSDRHKGIGSDGLVLIGQSPVPEADFSMRIFNADGSEAMMCGNASRCIAKYVYERALTEKNEVRLLTLSGIKTLRLHVINDKVEHVTVDMGEPQFNAPDLFRPNQWLDMGTFVSMGNPHYVIFTDDIDQVAKTGRALEHHPAFPQRCNIEFARIEPAAGPAYAPGSAVGGFPAGPDYAPGSAVGGFPADPATGPAPLIRTRVWERGSGITQACGTGACATAVAAALTGRAARKSSIVMDGGTLHIEWRETDNHVYMTGPATFVFEGEAEIPK